MKTSNFTSNMMSHHKDNFGLGSAGAEVGGDVREAIVLSNEKVSRFYDLWEKNYAIWKGYYGKRAGASDASGFETTRKPAWSPFGLLIAGDGLEAQSAGGLS